MFEFSQLRCFLAVAEGLHFGRAADRLHMTQPSLSRQIQLLEHRLGGVALFERSSRNVRLTPAGRHFVSEAQRLLRLAEGATLSVKQIARGHAGSVTLGFTAGSSYAFLPRLVALATEAMPAVKLVLREMRTAEQMESLAAGRLDAGLVRLPVDRRGLELTLVGTDAIMLAAPEEHLLSTSDAAPALPDLDRQPFVMYSPTEGRYFHDLVSTLLRAAEVAPDCVQFVSQVHTALSLVSAGTGMALVPESARNLRFPGVTLRHLSPTPKTRAELHLIWRSGSDNPALHQFRDLVLPKLETP